MYQKLNQNKTLKIALASLAVFMLIGLTASLPYEEVSAQTGTYVGGRIVYAIPTGYYWGISYCIPHMMVASVGAPYRGPIALAYPPAMPFSMYNFYTPGVSVKGSYFSFPIFGCPYPVYPTQMLGTSLR
jgi:hypothetical protein